MGLMDYGIDPQTQGLLAAAFAGLKASGPSRIPVSWGQSLGIAGEAGLNEYQQAAQMEETKRHRLAQEETVKQLGLSRLEQARQNLIFQRDKLLSQATNAKDALDVKVWFEQNDLNLRNATNQMIAGKTDAANSVMIANTPFSVNLPSAATVSPKVEITPPPVRGTPVTSPAPSILNPPITPPPAPTPIGAAAAQLVAKAEAEGKGMTIPVPGENLPVGSPSVPPPSAGVDIPPIVTGLIPPAPSSSVPAPSVIPPQGLPPLVDPYLRQRQAAVTGPQTPAIASAAPGTAPPLIVKTKDQFDINKTVAEAEAMRAKGLGSYANKAGADVIPEEHMNLHGEEYLATLPIGMRNVVKAVANYEMPLNVASMRTGNREALVARVEQFDPTFNAMKYGVRAKVMQDFTSGKIRDNRIAAGQALNHMGLLYDLGETLKNNDVQAVNALVNFARVQLGHSEVTNFRTAQQAVGEELMRLFRQVQASEKEVEDWKKQFDSKNSPDQIIGSLRTGAKLLEGRISEVNNTWDSAFDTKSGFPGFLSPAAQLSLDKILGRSNAPSNQGGWSIRPK